MANALCLYINLWHYKRKIFMNSNFEVNKTNIMQSRTRQLEIESMINRIRLFDYFHFSVMIKYLVSNCKDR